MKFTPLHRLVCILGTLAAPAALAQTAVSPSRMIGEVEVLDPAIATLIDPAAKVELLATGFNWSEGPMWIEAADCVVFSDVPENTVYKWKEGEGLSVYLRPSGYTGTIPREGESGSNGLAIDHAGRLVLAQHGDRRIARMDAPTTAPAPRFVTVTGDYQGQRFNSPNDLAIHSSGAIYFTDPPYGVAKIDGKPQRDLTFNGVFRVAPNGETVLLTDKLRAPNGIALSPDEQTLYVAQSDNKAAVYMAYHVLDDGTIDEGRVLLDVTPLVADRPGSPDGMKIDQQGNLFATGPGGVLIISPEGKHLGTIRMGERIANCAFGDDGRTLYMTCDMHFCRIRLKTIGVGF